MKRIAYYGGSFDPVHRGHLKIAAELTDVFKLDRFVLIPAFHAPHKSGLKPTSAFHRYAMLALATRNQPKIKVSKMELEVPGKPYTIETLTKLIEKNPDDEIFFVMGADSWEEITTWREWEQVLGVVNIIVVTRPGYEIGLSHVTDAIRERIVDLRTDNEKLTMDDEKPEDHIFITDAVQMNISSTKIRRSIRKAETDWEDLVSSEVLKYIRKYRLYKA